MGASGPSPTPKPTPTSPPTGKAPTKGPGKKPTVGVTLGPGDLVPVWMDVDTAKFLVRALTSALNQNIQPKKKKK
jgi:hypothetical protein